MPADHANIDKPHSIISLLMAVRDAKLARKADRQLLDALILRCRTKEKYKSWPTYQTLAEDTGLSQKTLRRAAAKLEDAGLIRRKSTASSNVFFVNADQIVLMGELARIKKAEAKAAARAAADNDEPDFETTVSASSSDTDWISGGAL